MLETLEPVRPLGRGGEGTVTLAWDPALSRWLAVKIVLLAPGARAAALRLLDELAAFARELLEPAVAPILASGLVETAPEAFRKRFAPGGGLAIYVIMPYVHGVSAGRLARGALPARTVAALFAESVRLLARLHAQGLAHLDLKPENVLIDVQGRVVLVDPHLSTVRGTSGYAAPEQARPEAPPPGAAADWYALGRVATALWTGRRAGEGEGLPELPAPATRLGGTERLAHERLAALVDAMTAPRPDAREVPREDEAEALARDLGATPPRDALATAVQTGPGRAELGAIELEQASHLARAIGAEQRAAGPAKANPPGRGPAEALAQEPAASPSAARGPEYAPSPAQPGRAGRESARRVWIPAAVVLLTSLGIAGGVHWLGSGRGDPPLREMTEMPDQPKIYRGRPNQPLVPPVPEDGNRAHVLGQDEAASPGDGLLTYLLTHPASELGLQRASGATLWRDEAPVLGKLYKFSLPPGDYVLLHVHPGNHLEQRQFEARAGDPVRLEANAYRMSAPKRAGE